jgi:hypothetical protein
MRLWWFSLMLLPTLAWGDADVITQVLQQDPQPEHFEFCQGGGCRSVQTVSLDQSKWRAVRKLFEPEAENAVQERHQLGEAIALLEIIVGPMTGTDSDRGGTFGNSDYPGQMDCNDEATNTTTYMRMIAREGLLRFHQVADTKTRGFFFNGWPHTTAVIQEIDSGHRFAVDSWFYDNGEPPVILPLQIWLGGWKPADSRAN